LLGQAIASSPFPGGLNAEQRKLYRAALTDRAEPLYAEARETLRSADAKARELGVTGQCSQQVAILLGKVSAKPAERTQLSLAQSPVFDVPMMVDVRALGNEGAARAAALAAARGDANAARSALALARAALGDVPAGRVLEARIELELGNPAAALAAVKTVLAQAPGDSGALCAMARA